MPTHYPGDFAALDRDLFDYPVCHVVSEPLLVIQLLVSTGYPAFSQSGMPL